MSWIKIIFYNGVAFLALVGLLLLSPPIIVGAYNVYRAGFFAERDFRAGLPNYEDIDWIQTHLEELSERSSTYYDYITWRHDDYAGTTINIVDGLRKTLEPQSMDDEQKEVWFFGGSTTWGDGVNDANTYPSIFAKKANARVKNFGTGAYIARQSSILLANQYIKKNQIDSAPLPRKIIVFYDGVNDVLFRCRRGRNDLATSRENEIQTTLGESLRGKWRFGRTFSQLKDVLVYGFSTRIDYKNLYDCDTNPEKSRMVAVSLVSIWEQAQQLAVEHGDSFLAILQPVSFVGSPNLEHLTYFPNALSPAILGPQYHAVYTLVKKEAEKRGIHFLDLTDAYNSRELLYIDYCHVTPRGHEILVPKIIAGLKAKGFL